MWLSYNCIERDLPGGGGGVVPVVYGGYGGGVVPGGRGGGVVPGGRGGGVVLGGGGVVGGVVGGISIAWSTKKTAEALRMIEMIALSAEFGTNCNKSIGISTIQ